MDPFQTTATRHLRPARKSTAEEIDAFYNDNACETLHDARRAMEKVARLLRATCVRTRQTLRPDPKIASAARQA